MNADETMPDLGAMLNTIERVLFALAQWEPHFAHTTMVLSVERDGPTCALVTARLTHHGGELPAANITMSITGSRGRPSYGEIVAALHDAAVKRALVCRGRFDAAVSS